MTLIVFLRGSNPSLLILLPSAARRIRTRDLDLWAAVAPSSRLQGQAACCPVISAEWTHGKRRNGDIVTRSAGTKVLPARIVLWALTYNCKGLWEIGTYYCFCFDRLFICPRVLTRLFVSQPFSLFFLVSHPSFTPYLNYFPFPLLSVSHPSSVSLPSSSSPSSLASYLNCSAHRRT